MRRLEHARCERRYRPAPTTANTTIAMLSTTIPARKIVADWDLGAATPEDAAARRSRVIRRA